MKSMEKLKKIIFGSVIITALFFNFSGICNAAESADIKGRTENTAVQTGLKSDMSLQEAAGTVINIATGFLGLLFFILALYGGITWMTASGDIKTIEKAKGTLISAVVGMVVVLLSYQVVHFIFESINTTLPATGSTPTATEGGPFVPSSELGLPPPPTSAQ